MKQYHDLVKHVLENGKAMGLSAYGNKDNNFPDLFANNSHIPNDYHFGHEFHDDDNLEAVYLDLTSLRNRNFTKHNVDIYADYALHVQQQTQDAVCKLIEKAVEKTQQKNIIITGGYGLNVVANAYYLKKFPELNFYFEPMADDSGTSIGGALLAHRILTKDTEINPLNTTCFHGRSYYIDNEIGEASSTEDIVDLLISQKSVALYKGLAEAGPRSLGHRSILFDARNINAVNIVNKIKKREWYRPFAVSILKEDCSKFFDTSILQESKYMTVNFDSTEDARKQLPGVIHVDGTCRIHTVDETDGELYNILKVFKEKTGIGALLNTSFNLAGYPLVETPNDAIDTLNSSELDYIWFADQKILRGKGNEQS